MLSLVKYLLIPLSKAKIFLIIKAHPFLPIDQLKIANLPNPAKT